MGNSAKCSLRRKESCFSDMQIHTGKGFVISQLMNLSLEPECVQETLSIFVILSPVYVKNWRWIAYILAAYGVMANMSS